MPGHPCTRCSMRSASSHTKGNFCPRCGRRVRESLTYQPGARAARSTPPTLLALGMAVSLLLAVAGVFLLVMSARGGGVWAMFAGLVTLSVGFAGVGSSAASALDTREPANPAVTSPPRRSS